MGLSSKEQDEYYEKYWNRIEEYTKYNVSSFIRDYLSLKQLVIPAQRKVYLSFKEYVEFSSLQVEDSVEPASVGRNSDACRLFCLNVTIDITSEWI